MIKDKGAIKESTLKIRNLFKRAYRFFSAAKSIRDDLEYMYEEAAFEFKIIKEIELIKSELLKDKKVESKKGKERHLFGSALTPNGLVDYYSSVIKNKYKIYYINSDSVNKASVFMKEISDACIKKSINLEVYHEPLDEKNIQMLVIPKLNVVLTSYFKYKENHYKKIDLMIYMKKNILKEHKKKIKEDKELIELLINKGISNLKEAKEEHDILENFYVKNMDFEKVEVLRNTMIKEVLTCKISE